MFNVRGVRLTSLFAPGHDPILSWCWPHCCWVSEFSLAGREGMWQAPIGDYLINVFTVTVLSKLLSSQNSTSEYFCGGLWEALRNWVLLVKV